MTQTTDTRYIARPATKAEHCKHLVEDTTTGAIVGRFDGRRPAVERAADLNAGLAR